MSSALPILIALAAVAQSPAPSTAAPSLDPQPVEEAATEVKELPSLDEVAPTLEVTQPVEAAPPHPCVGTSLYSVRLAGCRGPVCDSGEMRAGFVTITDIEPGQTLSANDVSVAIARLEATGFFRSVALKCTRKGDQLALVVTVAPHRFVRKVSIRGNQFFRESELSKRVTLHSGDALNVEPGQESDSETLKRLVESLKALYYKEGLEDVRFDVKVALIDETTVDLSVEITEGERDRVRSLDIAHQPAVVTQRGAMKCPSVEPRKLSALVGVNVGEVVTERQLREMKRRLKNFFQSIGFERPDIEADIVGDPLVLRVRVKTNQCWLVRVWEREATSLSASRAEPAFRFRDPVDTDESFTDPAPYERSRLEPWRGLLPFYESGVFEREEALRGVEVIRAILASQGFLFADVRLEHRVLQTRDKRRNSVGASPVMGTIDYYLTRNYERRLQGLTFEGLESFEEEVLLSVMDTQMYDFLGDPGAIQIQKVLYDLTKVKRYYQERGFYAFRYALTGEPEQRSPRRVRRTEGDSVVWEYRFRDRGFRIRKRKGQMVLYLEIPLIEGPQTKATKINIFGAKSLPPILAKLLLEIETGGAYGKVMLESGLKRIKLWYSQRGYHQMKVFPTCKAYDPEPENGDCDPFNVRSGKVEMVYRIDEGPQSSVGEIFWRGNFRTDPEVLLRDLPQPGDPYRAEDIATAARKLRNLGVFNSVKITPIGIDETPARDEIALLVTVEEGRTRFIDLAVGFRTIDRDSDAGTKAPAWLGSIIGQATAASDRSTNGLARGRALGLPDVLLKVEAEYLEYNFLGLGWQFTLPVQYGFSTSDPLRLGSLTPTIRIPRPGGTDLETEIKLLAEIDRVNDQIDRTEFGLYSSLNWPLMDQMTLGFALDFGMICFKQPGDSNPICDLDEYSPQFRPSIRWRWDTQNNPLNPTKGFTLSGEFKYIFGRSSDELIGLETANDLGTEYANFLKWETSAEVVIDTRIGPIIAAFVRYGGSHQIGGDGTSLLPANEIFTLGGSNGVRGYTDHAIGRYDAAGLLDRGWLDANGNRVGAIYDYRQDGGGNVVLNGSMEVRIPLVKRIGLWAATFVDAGAIARTHSDIHLESFRFSAGAGIRYLIGNQIPVRLDWGFALGDPRCTAWSRTADLSSDTLAADACAKEEEGNRIHFDLLYPF
ncbi:MAG: POTRA domain-containing protein [Myxococcota bacterium]